MIDLPTPWNGGSSAFDADRRARHDTPPYRYTPQPWTLGPTCGYCGALVDHVETANPMLPVAVLTRGTMTHHWRECPKQEFRRKAYAAVEADKREHERLSQKPVIEIRPGETLGDALDRMKEEK